MKRMISFCLLVSLLLSLFTGCAARSVTPETETDEPQTTTQETEQEQKSAIDAKPVADVASYQNDGDLMAFGVRMLQLAADNATDKNTVVSPLSAYIALCMLANGATGETKRELETVLGGDVAALNAQIGERMRALCDTQGETQMAYANSVWVDDQMTADADFCERMLQYYDAEMFLRQLSMEETKDEINTWVSEKTKGLIPELLVDKLNPSVLMLLINTLYFKAEWRNPFAAEDTHQGEFYTQPGISKMVDYLCAVDVHRDYFEQEDCEGVVLPYDDGKTAMILLKPTQGQDVRELMQNMSTETLQTALEEKQSTYLTLCIPKFEVEYFAHLRETLQAMGVQRAFEAEKAELGGLGTAPTALFVGDVLQKVKVIVDEKGTEAAAVTEITLCGATISPVEPKEVYFDEPFLYAIVDLETATPLFLGVLDDPTAE